MIFDIQLTYDDKNGASFGEILGSPECFIFEQFTGLRDRNGVEIYEGDLVELDPIWGAEKPREVFFKCGCFGVLNYIDSFLDMHYFYEDEDCELKVIGNIHENPELLDK